MSSSKPRLKRSGQTADQVLRRLVEAILNGEFPSGSVVRESRLAREWQTSRTPLREAMRRAAENGFIVLRPNQAPMIRPLTVNDLRDLYELREVLELHALELAWPHLPAAEVRSLRTLAARAGDRRTRDWVHRCLKFDLALHRLWTRRCGNSWLQSDLDRHYRFLRIFQSWTGGRDTEALAHSYQEHLGILDALERRDKAAALDCLRRHIRASAGVLEAAWLKSQPLPAQGDGRTAPLLKRTRDRNRKGILK